MARFTTTSTHSIESNSMARITTTSTLSIESNSMTRITTTSTHSIESNSMARITTTSTHSIDYTYSNCVINHNFIMLIGERMFINSESKECC